MTCEHWMQTKDEAKLFFQKQKYELACDKYQLSLGKLREDIDYDKNEAAKLLSNISLMYFKMFQEENEKHLLDEATKYAQESLDETPLWHKAYLRLAECYKAENNMDLVLDILKSYLDKVDDVPLEFQKYMNAVKYYTHRKVIMSSEVWDDIMYPENFVVIDQKGAGHFTDLTSILKSDVALINLSIVVQPGIYKGVYRIENANFQLIGNSYPKDFYENGSIKSDPSVVFTNSITLVSFEEFLQMKASKLTALVCPTNTFFLENCEATFTNLCVNENIRHHPVHAVIALRSKLNVYSSSFFSKCSAAIAMTDSTLNITKSKSCGAYSAVLSASQSISYLANCYISETVGVAVEVRDDNDSAFLSNCIIENCQKQGICVYSGSKSVKIKGCKFANNCSALSINEGSIQLRNCQASIKNTTIKDQKSVGVVIETGKGVFKNVEISNCFTGMLIQAPCYIKACTFIKCYTAINLCKCINGNIELVDNTIKNCLMEINSPDNQTRIVFSGKAKHRVNNFNINSGAMFQSSGYKKYNRMRNSDTGIDLGPVGEALNVNTKNLHKNCEFCGHSPFQLKTTFQFCGKCKTVLYCSVECQRKGWKEHKSLCERIAEEKLEFKKSGLDIDGKDNDEAEVVHVEVDDDVSDYGNDTQNDTQATSSKLPEWKRKKKKKKKKKSEF